MRECRGVVSGDNRGAVIDSTDYDEVSLRG